MATTDLNRRHEPLDRLEARIDHQTSRIDALYALLEEAGILQRPLDGDGADDALFDELVQIEDAPVSRDFEGSVPIGLGLE